MRARLAWLLLRVTISPWLRVSVRGSLPPGAFVLASNHLNWVDPFLYLGWLSPGRLVVLGRRSAVYDRWWKRALVDLSGMVLTVEPGHHELDQVTAAVVAGLRGSRGLLLFAEGGVEGGVEGELRPLRRGAAHFANAAGVPLVPAAVSGTSELWWGKRARITIGMPIATTAEESADTVLLADAMRALFAPLDQVPGVRRARWLTGLLR
jgi:1-acyl-sn-glycerol-3-phosphate acyltransferase